MCKYSRESLKELYVTKKLSIRAIAALLDSNPSYIRYWLLKYGIKLRKFNIGKLNKNKKLTTGEKELLSLQAKNRYRYSKHPRLGKKHTEETKKKISQSVKAKRKAE